VKTKTDRSKAAQPAGPASRSPSARALTEAQRAYETKRAAKAGMSLDKWLDTKQRRLEEEAKARQKAAEPPKPTKPPGLFARLLERAQKPLGS